MGKQCWSQAVLELCSWGHSVLQTPALVTYYIQFVYLNYLIGYVTVQKLSQSIISYRSKHFEGIDLIYI